MAKPALAPDPKLENLVDLNTVIKAVQEAVDDYQRVHGDDKALPPLASAEFDFKTTVDKVAGIGINFWIIKLGVTKTNEVVNQITFTYEPPKIIKVLGSGKPPELKDSLSKALAAAGAAVKNSDTDKLKFKKLAVTLQFGVKWDGNGGVAIPISLVTIGPNVDVNKNAVHSVKVVFGKTEG